MVPTALTQSHLSKLRSDGIFLKCHFSDLAETLRLSSTTKIRIPGLKIGCDSDFCICASHSGKTTGHLASDHNSFCPHRSSLTTYHHESLYTLHNLCNHRDHNTHSMKSALTRRKGYS
jgi:hypothetical protein